MHVIEKKTGEIVFTQIGKIPQTGETYGLITVKTSDDESIELKIDDSTEHGLLLTGTKVIVEFEESNDSEYYIARKIISKSEQTRLF